MPGATEAFTLAEAARLSGLARGRVRSLVAAGLVPVRPDGTLSFAAVAALRRVAAISPRRSATRQLVSGQLAAGQLASGQLILDLAPDVQGDLDRPAALADGWHRRGRALEEQAKDQACLAYRRALEIDPDHVAAHIDLGRLVHQAGDPEAAAAHYRHALSRREGDAVAWFNLGVAQGDLGDVEAALGCYRRALAVRPDWGDAHYNAARLCERRGDELGSWRHRRSRRPPAGPPQGPSQGGSPRGPSRSGPESR